MIKILLVEDDDTIAFGIRSALKRTGFEVMSCMSMTEGRKIFSEDISLVLLDLNLPDGSGYEFCRWVKGRRDTPIIFLTVLDDVADITKGLDMGADDYITKPFSIPVLESRIRAVIRRISKTEEDILSCSTIQMENKGCILPRSLILKKLWDDESNFVNDNTLTVAMKRLREKLKDAPCIKTVRGIGYRMEDI